MLLTKALDVVMIVGWILLAVMIAVMFVRRARLDGLGDALRRVISWHSSLLFLLIVLLTMVSHSLIFVQPEEVGVVVSLVSPNGYREQPVRSGLHWLAPLMEEIYLYPIAWQTYTMSRTPIEGERIGDDAIIARSQDGQEVAIDCSVIYQLEPAQTVRIHKEWQQRYQSDFVRPVTRGIVRTIASQYKAEELNSSKRKDLESQIDSSLRALFKDKGFNLDRFVLRNIAFSPEFALAIEQKQVQQEGVTRSEYEAQQVRNLAEGRADEVRTRANAEAEAIRLRAAADAEALRLIAQALDESPQLLSYRYIDKLAPNIRVMLVPNNAPYILPLDPITAGDAGADPAAASPTAVVSPTPRAATPTP